MGKRKRNVEDDVLPTPSHAKKPSLSHRPVNSFSKRPICIQIITGSYDRVLHGITATLSAEDDGAENSKPSSDIKFNDNFLFNAHSSAIRCLAISPLPPPGDITKLQKLTLASGGTDERINLYHISTHATCVKPAKNSLLSSLSSTSKQENPKNKELGALLHHSASINALYFPGRSKLLSGAEDNTIAVTRTRDWTVLSTIKAPIPKSVGRPSGDTAPPGNAPAGINDFAVHPSMKLMISIGKGEKCMRLWNLVTGKKAGVLTFERELLKSIGEGKWASGEGSKVRWNIAGDEFAVSFSRGAIIYGMDSKPKCCLLPSPSTKIHQIHYIPLDQSNDAKSDLLAVSTEDGQILLYSTAVANLNDSEHGTPSSQPPFCSLVARLGGKSDDVTGRLKDFEVLALGSDGTKYSSKIVIAAGSDGAVRLWRIKAQELKQRFESGQFDEKTEKSQNLTDSISTEGTTVSSIGEFLGKYDTGNRITCLKAFVLYSQEPFEAKEDRTGTNEGVEGQERTEDANMADGDSVEEHGKGPGSKEPEVDKLESGGE